MKKLLFIASLFIALGATAQADTATINITLKARHHAYIVSLLPDKGEIDKARYVRDVAKALKLPVDTAQLISVRVSHELIRNVYQIIGSQQERLTTAYNSEIREALISQLYIYPDIMQEIAEISQRNGYETGQIVSWGFDYLKAYKQ